MYWARAATRPSDLNVVNAIRSVSSRVLEVGLLRRGMNSTKTLGAFLLLFLAACTIQLAPAGPDEELPVSEPDENVSDEPSTRPP